MNSLIKKNKSDIIKIAEQKNINLKLDNGKYKNKKQLLNDIKKTMIEASTSIVNDKPIETNDFFNDKSNWMCLYQQKQFNLYELLKIYNQEYKIVQDIIKNDIDFADEYTELENEIKSLKISIKKIKNVDDDRIIRIKKKKNNELINKEAKLNMFLIDKVEHFLKDKIFDDVHFKKSKEYINLHIAQHVSGNCPYYFINTLETINIRPFQITYLDKFPKLLQIWFNKTCRIMPIKIETTCPDRIIKNKYINAFKGFRFKNVPLDKFNIETKNKADWILENYIKKFISNNDENIYSYVISWISNICKGNKNTTMLILESILKGVGKSTFISFMIELLGDDATLKGDPKDILGNTNIHWLGKLFIYFEELTVSQSNYTTLSNNLKDLVTEDKIRYRGLFKDALQEKNTLNFVSCSNNLRCIKDNTGRRFLTLDLPAEKYKNQTEYFDELRKYISNKKVMCYLFNYFLNYKINVNLRIVPETIRKLKALVLSYSPLHNFIRYKYLFIKRRIWCRKTELLNEYIKYRLKEDEDFKIPNKITFKKNFYNDLDNKLGIVPKNSLGLSVYHIPYEILEQKAKIYSYDVKDETDDFFDSKDKIDLNEIANKTFEEMEKEKNNEIKKLKKQIEDRNDLIKSIIQSFSKTKCKEYEKNKLFRSLYFYKD